MDSQQMKEWYNRFKDGRTSMESEARSGGPSTSRNEIVIDEVRTLVMQDRQPHSIIITMEYYQEVLRRLRDAVRRKRLDLWAASN